MHPYFLSLIGGALIGLAASAFYFTHGRVAGVSGLFSALVLPGRRARVLGACFVAGLAVAGLVFARVSPPSFSLAGTPALPLLAVSGLLVGYGTRLGGGCTSGHGVCGLSHFSARSLAAVVTFMATGMATVFVVRHVL